MTIVSNEAASINAGVAARSRRASCQLLLREVPDFPISVANRREFDKFPIGALKHVSRMGSAHLADAAENRRD